MMNLKYLSLLDFGFTPAYHPAGRAGAFSSHMMTHAAVLTGTALFTLPPMFPWRAQVLAAARRHQTQASDSHTLLSLSACSVQVNLQRSRVSRAANALSGDVVARGVVLAQAPLLAAVSVGGALAEILAAPAAVPGRTEAGSGDGVTQRLVLTLTAAAAVRTPVITVTCCTNTQSCISLPYQTQ